MLFFFITAVLVLAGLCSLMAWRTLALCPFLQQHPLWVWSFFALFLVLLFGGMALHRVPALTHRIAPLQWIGYGLFGFVSTYFVYLLGADLIQIVARKLFHAPQAFSSWAFVAAASLSVLSVLAGLLPALRPVALRSIEVPIAGLPPELDGFRIVQISDLHLGPTVRHAQIEHIVSLSNAQRPDLIAITGDLVDSGADGTRDKALRMGRLEARHGVYFVTGNHEYYAGLRPWLALIRGLGWKILLNEHAVLTHEGAQVVVAGMPDPAARARRIGAPGDGPDLARALAGAPPEATRILLFHPPLMYAQAEAAGVHLQLSGHTHGGQYFPWSLVVQRIFAYSTGLHRHGGMWIHTSPGTGFWGPPNRFLVPPELTLIRLRRA